MAGAPPFFLLIFALASATLLEALAFLPLLLTTRFRAARANRFLAAMLVFMAAAKADQLFQMLGGLEALPRFAFLLAPFQVLLTPALYFYARARVEPARVLRPRDLWHLVPFGLYTLYLAANVYLASADARAQFLDSGLAGSLNRLIIPVVGDALQLGYIVAVLALLRRHSILLRDFHSRVEGRDLGWLRGLMPAWTAVFLLHLALTLALPGSESGIRAPAFLLLNAMHLVFVTLLITFAIVDFVEYRRDPAPVRYRESSLSAEDRTRLYTDAEAALARGNLFCDPDLTLADLADRVAATPRELSEAINGAGGMNFFEFVNRRRIAHAMSRLTADPEARILDVALESGFNSKSAFNAAFRRHAGTSPSAFRSAAGKSEPLTT